MTRGFGGVPRKSFDHYDPDYARNPYPALAELRERCPVVHSDDHGGYWMVSNHEFVRHVALHPEIFSTQYTTVPPLFAFGEVRIAPLQLDPEDHGRVKQLLTPPFGPARAAALEESTRAAAVAILDDLVSKGRFDASQDFARLVPTGVIGQLLGIPEEFDRLTGWVKRMVEHITDAPEDMMAAGMEMFLFMNELVDKRRAEPGSDIISAMLASEVDGQRLEPMEVVMSAVTFVLAGIDTAWSTLGSALHYLATHPDDQQRLRDEPELLETAREEFLRAFAPVASARVAKEDTELGGETIKAGEMVLVSFPSGCRDGAEFEAPDEVRLDRTPNRHLAFGTGIHRCLGVNVARMELRVGLEEFLRRVPPFRLDGDEADAVDWTLGQVRGPKKLLVTFAAQ
jgi:cytochrome P450